MNNSKGPEVVPEWPVYDLVRIRFVPDVPPNMAARLAETRVPRRCIGHEYRVLPEATFLGRIAERDLVAFGISGSSGRVCVDLATGTVVHVPTIGGSMVNVVNADLAAFCECVAAVIARFPFYGEDDEPEQFEEVAEELRHTIGVIDESALVNNGFWGTFADDVAIGDYATEMIV
jgi:hypothetical protein